MSFENSRVIVMKKKGERANNNGRGFLLATSLDDYSPLYMSPLWSLPSDKYNQGPVPPPTD